MSRGSLYKLIHNLSVGERKMVRKILEANKPNAPSNFLKVFDVVINSDGADRKELDKKLKTTLSIKNLPATKYQLYYHILEIVSNQTDNFDTKYYQQANKIDYLVGKLMHEEALKLIDALVEEVKDHERHHFLADLHYKKVVVLRSAGRLKECNQLVKLWATDKSKVVEARKIFDDAYNMFYKLYLSYCNSTYPIESPDKELYQAFINESFMNRDQFKETDNEVQFGTSFFYHNMALMIANLALSKFNQSFRYSSFLYNVCKKNHLYASYDVHLQALILYNHAVSAYFINRMDEFEIARGALQKLDWHGHQGEKGYYELFYNMALSYLSKTVTEIENFKMIEQKVAKKLEKTVRKLHPIKKRQLLNDVKEILEL